MDLMVGFCGVDRYCRTQHSQTVKFSSPQSNTKYYISVVRYSSGQFACGGAVGMCSLCHDSVLGPRICGHYGGGQGGGGARPWCWLGGGGHSSGEKEFVIMGTTV